MLIWYQQRTASGNTCVNKLIIGLAVLYIQYMRVSICCCFAISPDKISLRFCHNLKTMIQVMFLTNQDTVDLIVDMVSAEDCFR